MEQYPEINETEKAMLCARLYEQAVDHYHKRTGRSDVLCREYLALMTMRLWLVGAVEGPRKQRLTHTPR